MHRSQVETKYLKSKTQADLKPHKMHKIFCRKLYRKERRKYHESLDMKNILDTKKFGKRWNPFCPITIEKNNRIISDDFVLSEEFSTFFEDAVRLLNVKPDEY